MKRLLALLMIPLLVVGNSFPHTHASGDIGSDHAERPHLHAGACHHAHGGHQHHHGHEDAESDECQQIALDHPSDHDSDAIYLSGGQFFLPASADSTQAIQLDCVGFVASNDRLISKDCQPNLAGHRVPIGIGPPLFLLHAALRL